MVYYLLNKYQYNDVVIYKGNKIFNKVLIVGIKFDSKVTSRKNPSRISYYVTGLSIRKWVFEEEIKYPSLIRLLIYRYFKF